MIQAIRIRNSEAGGNAGTWHIIRSDNNADPSSLCGFIQKGRMRHKNNKAIKGTGTVEAETIPELKQEINGKFGQLCKNCSKFDVAMHFSIKKIDEQIKDKIRRLALEKGVTTKEATEHLLKKGLETQSEEMQLQNPEQLVEGGQ